MRKVCMLNNMKSILIVISFVLPLFMLATHASSQEMYGFASWESHSVLECSASWTPHTFASWTPHIIQQPDPTQKISLSWPYNSYGVSLPYLIFPSYPYGLESGSGREAAWTTPPASTTYPAWQVVWESAPAWGTGWLPGAIYPVWEIGGFPWESSNNFDINDLYTKPDWNYTRFPWNSDNIIDLFTRF